MLIRLLCVYRMTTYVRKILLLNSKQLLSKLQKILGGYFFSASCTSMIFIYGNWCITTDTKQDVKMFSAKNLNGKMMSLVTKNVRANTAKTTSHSWLYLQYFASFANCDRIVTNERRQHPANSADRRGGNIKRNTNRRTHNRQVWYGKLKHANGMQMQM